MADDFDYDDGVLDFDDGWLYVEDEFDLAVRLALPPCFGTMHLAFPVPFHRC